MKTCWNHFVVFFLQNNENRDQLTTDKRTDVWSRDFIIWKINFGLLAVAQAGQWEKGVWADSEQLFWVVFSIFHGQKKIFFEFFLHCSVRTEKLHKIKLKFFKKNFGKGKLSQKNQFFLGLKCHCKYIEVGNRLLLAIL